MKYGTNSRRGSSSVIIVMVVVIIALAGTAVYVALDNTVLTKNGYAMPGSTFEITATVETDGQEMSVKSTQTVYGYADGMCVFGTKDTELLFMNTDEVNDDPNIEISTVNLNVPGLGNTTGTKYSMTTNDSNTMIYNEIITILHGIPYSTIIEGTYDGITERTESVITDMNVKLGDYSKVSGSDTFTNSTSSIVVEATSESIDGMILYQVSKTNGDRTFFVGDEDMIPYFIDKGDTSYDTTRLNITFNNTGITSIRFDGVTYT